MSKGYAGVSSLILGRALACPVIFDLSIFAEEAVGFSICGLAGETQSAIWWRAAIKVTDRFGGGRSTVRPGAGGGGERDKGKSSDSRSFREVHCGLYGLGDVLIGDLASVGEENSDGRVCSTWNEWEKANKNPIMMHRRGSEKRFRPYREADMQSLPC